MYFEPEFYKKTINSTPKPNNYTNNCQSYGHLVNVNHGVERYMVIRHPTICHRLSHMWWTSSRAVGAMMYYQGNSKLNFLGIIN